MKKTITVRLTHDEFMAVRAAVSGELESLTDHDEKSGVYDDLHAAEKALTKAWQEASHG